MHHRSSASRVRLAVRAAAMGTVLATLAACGSSGGGAAGAGGPVFDSQAGATLTCMDHQTATPTDAYRTGKTANTGELLTMLRYYTKNGARPYCDGAAPTATDKNWLNLYIAAVGNGSKVARWIPALKSA